jgi:hypothetical protein
MQGFVHLLGEQVPPSQRLQVPGTLALHLPNPDRVMADYAFLAALSRGLSGGDILNVCVNAIYAGNVDSDPAKWVVTQSMLERQIGFQ